MYKRSHNGINYQKKYQNSKSGKIAIYNAIYKYQKTEKGKLAASKTQHKRRKNGNLVENTLTAEEWEQILQEQDYRCADINCRKLFDENNKPTKDHIIPLSKGGGLTYENTQAMCRSCNSKKNNKLDPYHVKTLQINMKMLLAIS